MLIVRVSGGLGNQMQNYALYQKLRSLGKEAKLDLSWFDKKEQEKALAKRDLELGWFLDLPMEICTPEEKRAITGGDGVLSKVRRKLFGPGKVFTETEMYQPEVFELEEGYIEGPFSCEKYYADILPQLRELFRFPETEDPAASKKNQALIRKLEEEERSGDVTVSVHLRRGDYLQPENAALLGGISTPEYYRGAVRLAKQRLLSKDQSAVRETFLKSDDEIADQKRKWHFYLFSDDPDYARTLHFGAEEDENTVIDWNRGRDCMQDMALMSFCRVNICANSSFSFWGARLNGRRDKLMIRPLSHKNTLTYDPARMHELWAGWELVDRDGSTV